MGIGVDEPKRFVGGGEVAEVGAGDEVEPKRPRMSSMAAFLGPAGAAVGEVGEVVLMASAAAGAASDDELPKISARRSWLLCRLG